MRSTTKDKGFLQKVLPIVIWIIIWQIIALGVNKQLYIPTPLSTFKAIYEIVLKADFWLIIGMSIYRVLFGFIIALIVGSITGIIAGLNNMIYQLFHPMIVTIKSTPVLSFIIIALLWFGSGNVPIFICFLMCYPIIWISVVEGIKNVNTHLLEMAKIYEVKNKYIIKKIFIPTIKPYVVTGILNGLGLGWKVTVAAEVLSHPKYAIGAKLHDAKIYLESERLFAWTIVVIVLSMFFEFLFQVMMKRLDRKGFNVQVKDEKQ